MHIQITTPEKIVLNEDVDSVTIPTTTGEITVLPHHIPLVSQIAPGILVMKKGGKEEDFVLQGGFVQVTEKEILILADYAVAGKDVSVAQAEDAKKRAERAMKEKANDRDFALAELEFKRAILELKAASRKRAH